MTAPAALDLQIKLQPKQKQLLQAILDRRVDAPTVLGFGGSRGAAKSGGVRRLALILATETPGCIIWIMRRVWDDLNKDHVMPLWHEYPDLQPFYRAINHELRLPNGSSIFFIHAGDSGRSKRKARGPQAHYIFLEQAEEFSQEEMEQLAGSNRAPGVQPGFCKRIYTFNPGGIGIAYLRRIFHLKQYNDNERPEDFMFIQGFGWDNYEWFRGLEIVSEWDFYHSPEWVEAEEPCHECQKLTDPKQSCRNEAAHTRPKYVLRRFQVFVEQTDLGRKLNVLPSSQRIGELMGSFDKFSGQYYADVWEPSITVLPADLVGRIIKPWWRRWLATDWGFSHYCATGWFASGLLSSEEAADFFGVTISGAIRIIIQYRELVCNDVPEPDLARLIISMTPEAERREIRDHWIGHDAWAKRGSANTVVEQMEPILAKAGLQRLSKADIDRVGGWRLLYNAWASARRFRHWPGPQPFVEKQEDIPMFFVSAACPETQSAIPVLQVDYDPITNPDGNPQDVRKIAGKVEDDVADMVRYGLKSYLAADPTIPADEIARQTYSKYEDPTQRAMAMLHLSAQQAKGRYISRRRRL